MRWPDVLAALGRCEAAVLGAYRDGRYGRLGSLPSEWPSRVSREAMCDALTSVEDVLESEHPRWPERQTLASIRRRLETELWP